MSFEVSGPAVERSDVDPDRRRAGLRRACSTSGTQPDATSCSSGGSTDASRGGPHRTPRLPARDRRNPFRQTGRSRPHRRPDRPPGRDHRPDRAQDDDQRAELRRQGVAGRPRGRQHPALGQRRRRPGQPVRRRARHRVVHQPRRPGVRAARRTAPLATIVVRPRGWHLDERHITVDGRIAVGALVDFGLHFFHNAKALLGQGIRPVLLPAQDGEPSRGAAVERRLRHGAGGRSASRTARSGPPC